MAERGLLQGLRVVEIGNGLASSIVGLLLADQGAEVVRITSHRDDVVDPVLDAVVSRGKIDVRLETDEQTTETLDKLLAQADVVVENRRFPGCNGGIADYEQVRNEINPGLVSCAISPFPEGDPRGELPAYEPIAGLAGFLYNKPIGRPYLHAFRVGSVTAALYAVNGIVAALIARHRFGGGQHLSTSLYEACLVSQVLQILVKAGVPRGFLPLRMVGSPFMRVWQCKDGRYVYLHITLPKHNARMLEILDETGFSGEVQELRQLMSEQTIGDPSQVGSIAEAKKLKAIYEDIFLKRSADQWEEVLGTELCCIKVRTIEEWLKDSLDAGMSDACSVEDPVFGELLGPGPMVVSPSHPPTVAPRIVAEAALDGLMERWKEAPKSTEQPKREIGELHHPLEGIRVVDLSRIIAGPCAARVLAELGAEVLSIQSETRLDWALSFHLVFNAGKKSVTLDFTTESGKEKLWAIMDEFGPDIFVQNYRNLELAQSIGVDPKAVRARFPDVVYAYLNAYGNEGIWKTRPGFEQVVQAVSGIQLSYARGGPPKLLPSPIIDIGCGLLGAFGALAGLYNKLTNGEGTVITTHLTSMSVLLQLPQISAFQREACLQRANEEKSPVRFTADREVVALLVSTRTGHALVAGPRSDVVAWLHQSGLGDVSFDQSGLANLVSLVSLRTVSSLRESLRAAGVADSVGVIGHTSIRHVVEEVAHFDKRLRPIVRRREYPGSSQPMVFVGNPIRLMRTPLADIPATPMRGTHTHEVLAQIGEKVPIDTGVIPYPPNKSLPVWLLSFVRWGYFAWKSGNI